MALWPIIQFLVIIAIIILLVSQWIYPLWTDQPLFPWFRRKKKPVKVVEIKKDEPMSADKALELMSFHSEKALHFIAVAESYAQNEEKEAQEKLNKALSMLETVRNRAEKIKNIHLN